MHIISGWQVAVNQGRYTWRHDNVLQELADVLEMEKERERPSDTKQRQIQFLRHCESTADRKLARHTPLLDTALR